MTRVSSRLLLFACAMAAAAPALAQQVPDPPKVTHTVVVTGTVAPVALHLGGRSVTLLGRDDLERLGIVSFADALRLVAGADVRARGPFDVQTDFSIRGATFGQQLVLADGIRLNNSQSGHHNGELPIAIAAIDRVEVALGPSSAAHGADALGGVINVISRSDAHQMLTGAAGQHGYASAAGSLSRSDWLIAGWGSRSSGFAFDRDFASGGAAIRGRLFDTLTLDVRHQRRAFGADQFYGPSPSKEWTNQTLVAASYQALAQGWIVDVRGSYRHHRDHFRWDINRPGFAENRHQTDASEAGIITRREIGPRWRIAMGTGAGGDWIRSNNLGRHRFTSAHGFGELQFAASDRALLQGGVRWDDYSTFGGAWSPTLSGNVGLTDRLRIRASAGRAFRVPTFTERYYRDPAHEASGDLIPERGWSADAALDWIRASFTASLTTFLRRDRHVIDWVKAQPQELWRTTNIRRVRAAGVEAAVLGRWREAFVRVAYTHLDVNAADLSLLSKYVLEYARRSASVAVAAPVVAGVRAASAVDYRDRADGQTYAVASLQVSRRIDRVDVFVRADNLFDVEYREIAGVRAPGRWISAGVTIK